MNRGSVRKWTIREKGLAHRALPIVLDHIAGEAWLVDELGRIVIANGRASSAMKRLNDLEARLRRAIACGDPELSVTVVGGRPAGHFIVRMPQAPTRMDVRDIAKHLDFTQAQARVLDLLVEGLSNATISARLGIAERTVEAHLTAMLRKSGLASRGALIARILR